jgi:hypothetical protein
MLRPPPVFLITRGVRRDGSRDDGGAEARGSRCEVAGQAVPDRRGCAGAGEHSAGERAQGHGSFIDQGDCGQESAWQEGGEQHSAKASGAGQAE